MAKTKKITDATFYNKAGKLVNVKDVVSEEECWFVEKEKRYVLAHRAIKKIASIAGISKNYDVIESPNVLPSYKNELEHIVRVTITCQCKKKGNGCMHDELDNTLTVTGEANRTNTPVRGRGYLRKMAEKRAFDIAVLEHLGLYDTTFSEEESETMLGNKSSGIENFEISNVELESIRHLVNILTNAVTEETLQTAITQVHDDITKTKYSQNVLNFLTHLIKERKRSTAKPEVVAEKPF